MQTRHWCFTINNWSEDDENRLKAIGATYLVFGYERGSNETPHLQGYICFPQVKRFREAKAKIGENAHLERMRGTPQQAADYCKKDGLFYEDGVPPTGSKGCSVCDRFIQWIVSRRDAGEPKPSDREIANEFPVLWLRHQRKLRELAEHMYPETRFETESNELREWQEVLKTALLDRPPDNRSILFYVDEEGGKGKTFLQRYMLMNHGDKTQVLSVGKRDDIAHAVDESKNIFLFNVPRGGMEFMQYTILEQLKDQMVFSPKYDSKTKLLARVPHVVVFCNEEPNMEKMSADRYMIVNI